MCESSVNLTLFLLGVFVIQEVKLKSVEKLLVLIRDEKLLLLMR